MTPQQLKDEALANSQPIYVMQDNMAVILAVTQDIAKLADDIMRISGTPRGDCKDRWTDLRNLLGDAKQVVAD